ncbi:hypothetical protein [Marinilactibacillus sp. Marseille-P9653]|uniref:hypothetical protein n=1 Tax=Marinilactibacillus sp. Marseille-P9653 TaxID=2866583 RepID=UPI001CE44A0E|nr:hypothetical protein [Marinilactibacillus sp. Marseille-P9653]
MENNKIIRFNQHFNKQDDRYLDIPLNSDVKKFVDPVKIAGINEPLFDSKKASFKVQEYFKKGFSLYAEGNKNLAISLLSEPKEINATHLGLSKGASKGNGPSEEILDGVFQKITSEEFLRNSFMARPTLIPLFVPNFGADRFSDLTVNIISKELAEFTENICKELGIPVYVTGLCKYYDVSDGKWKQLVANLPMGPDKKPILLVPAGLVTDNYKFSIEKFVYTVIFAHLKDEHLNRRSPLVTYKEKNGVLTPVKPTNRVLKEHEIRTKYKDRGMLKAFALDKSLEHPHLLEQYISFIEDEKYQ